MYIYKKDDPVPMKFHYVMIVILALKSFSSIGSMPQMIDTERILRGTNMDWAGKFSVAAVALLIVMGVGAAILLFKRNRNGPNALYIFWATEFVVRVIDNYAAWKLSGIFDYNTVLLWLVFTVLIIAVSAVYYGKRIVLFGESDEKFGNIAKNKSENMIAWMSVAGYLIIGVAHFFMAYVIYQTAKFWFFMVVLLVPGIGDLIGIWFLLDNAQWGPLAVYAVGIILFVGSVVASAIRAKTN